MPSVPICVHCVTVVIVSLYFLPFAGLLCWRVGRGVGSCVGGGEVGRERERSGVVVGCCVGGGEGEREREVWGCGGGGCGGVAGCINIHEIITGGN